MSPRMMACPACSEHVFVRSELSPLRQFDPRRGGKL